MIIRKTTPGDDTIYIEVEGSLGGDDSVRELESLLADLEKGAHRHITFNFLKVPAINSSNLGKLFLFFNKIRTDGRTLRIRGCSDTLFKTFQLIEMENHIPYDRDVI
jgi:anti-anti-sigma regulatory factor